MQPPHQHSRINLAELKAQIVRKLGPEWSKQYFHYLNRFLGLKLSRVEFNSLCLRIVGRENIPLHNQFIRSILKNACSAKVPPPTNDEGLLKSNKAVEHKQPSSDGYQRNGSYPVISQASIPPSLSNGDILPLSPRKARTGMRDRRCGDRRSALGLNGKTNLDCQQSLVIHSSDNVLLENGNLTPPDSQRLVQHHQGLTQQAENEEEVAGHHLTKLLVTNRSPDIPVSVHSIDHNELLVVEDGKDVSARSPLRAPLGVPLCPVSVGGSCKALPLSSSNKYATAVNSDGLLDTLMLRERMVQIAATHDLEGVSMDCANLLNNGLDTYLKGLIRSCIKLVGARSGLETGKNSALKQPPHMKLINGVIPVHHYQMQSNSGPFEATQEHRHNCSISMLDFRVAMELNPQQLGKDWPLLLEKICTHAFEE